MEKQGDISIISISSDESFVKEVEEIEKQMSVATTMHPLDASSPQVDAASSGDMSIINISSDEGLNKKTSTPKQSGGASFMADDSSLMSLECLLDEYFSQSNTSMECLYSEHESSQNISGEFVDKISFLENRREELHQMMSALACQVMEIEKELVILRK